MRPSLCLVAVFALAAGPAPAEIRVTYQDLSPDIITIRNGSAFDLGPFELTVDLGTSPAGLIFDVSGTGAGFAGWAPLSVIAGGEQVLAIGEVTDGDTRLVVRLDFLAGHGTVAIAVDVDDTDPASALGPTIIAPSEIAGATAHVSHGGPPVSATFGPDGLAVLPLEACIA